MDQTDKIQLKLDTSNAEVTAGELQAKIAHLETQIKLLDGALEGGSITIAQYKTAHKDLEKQVKATNAELERLAKNPGLNAKPSGPGGGGAVGGGTDAARAFTSGIRDAGRITQDAMFGFGAITNNLIEIAPAVGLLAVGLDLLTKNSENIANAFRSWNAELEKSNGQLSQSVSLAEGFFRGFNFESAKRSLLEIAESATGLTGLAERFSPSEATRAKLSDITAGKEALDRIQDTASQERRAGLEATIKEAGGGKAFRDVLTKDLSKDAADEMIAEVGRVLKDGSELSLKVLQGRLRDVGRFDLAGDLTSLQPANVKQQQEFNRREEASRKEAEKHNERARELQQAEADRLANIDALSGRLQEKGVSRDVAQRVAEDRFSKGDPTAEGEKIVRDEFDKLQRERQSKQKTLAGNVLDETGGLDQTTKVAYMQGRLSGQSPEASADAIAVALTDLLVRKGVDQDVAMQTASDRARAVRKSLEGELVQQANRSEPARRSEQFALIDMTKQAQTAGGVQVEQRDLLKRLVELGGEQVRALSGGFGVVVP